MGRLVALGLVAALAGVGCSSEDGDRDQAKSLVGPGVEVHCAGLQKRANLDRFPGGVGDTSVDVNCLGTQP